MHKNGTFHHQNGSAIEVANALFDSGAIHSSYMSRRFYDRHTDFFGVLTSIQGFVRLGDHKTLCKLHGSVHADISFIDENGDTHRNKIKFNVFDMDSNDVIIGLPDIAKSFHFLFSEMVWLLRPHDENESHMNEDLSRIEDDFVPMEIPIGTILPPWSTRQEVAEEELSIPDPVNFSEPLHFMENTYEQNCEEFRRELPKHICPDLLNSPTGPKFVELMLTLGLETMVPRNWHGINGIPPAHVEWKDTLPDKMVASARPVNPRLLEDAKKEFNRLLSYFYRFSNSPWASPLVIAPKATKPFIRFCGDYVKLNKFILSPNYPIPRPLHEIEKAKGFEVFLDLDMTNGFHQVPLDGSTSRKLSLKTPWGQVEPMFMPEGIPCASFILHKTMTEIFEDCAEWTIVIFDNILVCAHDYEDAYEKMKIILTRCKDRNVFLKLSKSFMGYPSATFFGYEVSKGTYGLTDARTQGITEMVFPSTIKGMQIFIGMCIFFAPFIPNFAAAIAPLTDMTRKDFNWSERSKWEKDYEAEFEAFKSLLCKHMKLFHPNYELQWTLRTDACELGWGGILFQTTTDGQNQPLFCVSRKFSREAKKWKVIKREAYGVYGCVNALEYMLRVKEFLIQTDHNNLVYIEKSIDPMISRMCSYMKSFPIQDIIHIPGNLNKEADAFSRLWPPDVDFPPMDEETRLNTLTDIALTYPPAHKDVDTSATPPPITLSQQQLLESVHGGRKGHFGITRTLERLDKEYPGHNIPMEAIREHVLSCPCCQKNRLGLRYQVQPLIKTHHRVAGPRSMVCADLLKVEKDEDGFEYIILFSNHFSKKIKLYKSKNKSAESFANALLKYVVENGLFEELRTDNGSDYTAEATKIMLDWLGTKHSFTITHNPKGSNAEGPNGQVLRHLRAIVYDERIAKSWSKDHVLLWVEYFINNSYNSEIGAIPQRVELADFESIKENLPEDFETLSSKDKAAAYTIAAQKQLSLIRTVVADHHKMLDLKRRSSTENQTLFQRGDLVVYRSPEPASHKLAPRQLGPFEVLLHVGNNVEMQHLVSCQRIIVESTHLSRFIGDRKQGIEAAMRDDDQFKLKQILAYKGDPSTRTTCEFFCEFDDGTKIWKPFDQDLRNTDAFWEYCKSLPQLRLLNLDATMAFEDTRLNRAIISPELEGATIYVDLRSWSATWYDELNIPDKHFSTYVVMGICGKIIKVSKTLQRIDVNFPVLGEHYRGKKALDGAWMKYWGSQQHLLEGQILVDASFAIKYPDIIDEPIRSSQIEKLKRQLQQNIISNLSSQPFPPKTILKRPKYLKFNIPA